MAGDHFVFRCIGFPNHNGRQQPLCQDAENQLVHFGIILHLKGMVFKWMQLFNG